MNHLQLTIFEVVKSILGNEFINKSPKDSGDKYAKPIIHNSAICYGILNYVAKFSLANDDYLITQKCANHLKNNNLINAKGLLRAKKGSRYKFTFEHPVPANIIGDLLYDIGPFDFGADGSEFDKLLVKGSGSREGCVADEESYGNLEMYGSNVFLFTMSVVPKSIKSLLKRTLKTLEDIDLIVFHQASKLVIHNIIKKLLLNEDKVFTNYDSIGNTVSATIPIALKYASSQGRLKNGDTVMVVGFGLGLSRGTALINWRIEK